MAGRIALVRALRGARSGLGNASRGLATTMPSLPEISDPDAKKALKLLLAVNWGEIDPKVAKTVESALSKGGSEPLLSTYRAARAVEEFYDTIETLRQRMDGVIGVSGEMTGPLPEKYQKALEVAHSRYDKYVSSFGEDELYLKKKVEVELGSMMIFLKQRCSGLDPKWGDVGLIGTSGLSGSYIEKLA